MGKRMFVPKSQDWLLVREAAVVVLPMVAVEALFVGDNLAKRKWQFYVDDNHDPVL